MAAGGNGGVGGDASRECWPVTGSVRSPLGFLYVRDMSVI